MTHPRSGAALIMAIVILAALLMLGLPFLFSQSASLSGTRSFAHSQQAQSGRTTAEDLGVGAATYLTRMLFAQGSTSESTDLNRVGMGLTPATEPRRRTLDLSPSGHGFNPSEPRNTALIGLSLEDEAGKLDPNHLDVEAWDRLLQNVGVGDWDDGTGNTKDTDGYGQLAYALASVRFDQNICPTGRITRLEQLLEAKPLPEGVRHPLTRAELAQLKPYLTLVALGQGREGLVDLGTIVRVRAGDEVLDSAAPSDVVAYPTAPGLVAAGSVIVSKHPTRPLPPAQQQRGRRYHYGMSTSTDLDTIPTGNRPGNLQNMPRPSGYYPDSHRPGHEEAVALEIPAPVNLIESSKPVREVLWSVRRNAPNDLHALMRTPAALPDVFGRQITGYHLINPLGVFDDMDVNSSATVEQSRINDANSGINNMNPPNDMLTASATVVHINGGALDRMPGSGFARIESVDPSSGNTSQVEYISYRGGLPAGGGRATIHNVTRGLNFPGSTGPLEHPAGSRITVIAPRELPPLALTSQGLVTIESGASVADAAGRQGAQQMRRVVAQAVQHEQLLEVRWEKPTHYHALLVQRHGSLMNAFPTGYQRLRDELPENRTAARGPDKDDQIGVKPGTLRTHLMSTHLGTSWRNGHEWFVRFGVEGATPNNADFIDFHLSGQQGRPAVGGYGINDLSPEGLKLTRGPLAYPMTVAPLPNDASTMGGFLTHPITTRTTAPLNGRQFGMWVKPTQTLSGTVTLFDLRSPAASAGERYAQSTVLQPDGMQQREPGDNYYQNRLTLAYEDATKQLVLTICNGAIEHLADHGQVCPGELYTFPGTGAPVPPMVPGPYVDPRCLGTVAAAGTSPGVHPLAPRRPLNLVQHRYQLSQIDGLKADQWHLIQVALVGNDPGHMAITVNGVVGREVTRMTGALQMRDVGDHLTLPSLVLRTALPATTGSASNPSQIIRPAIEVDAVAVDPVSGQVVTGAAAVAAILPARGMIRIGNEYISYENIMGTTLVNCLRARRQDTFVGGPQPNYNWLVLEEHRAGDLIVPGGMRYNPGSTGHLWKGGCTLAWPLPNGDPMRNYTVWAELSTPSTIDMTTGLPVLQMAATTIGVQNGVLMQWPPRGYARLSSGEIIYYDNGAPPGMTLNNVQRGQLGTMPMDLLFPAVPTPANIPTITLMSFEAAGDPTGNYPNIPPPMPGVPATPATEAMLVQIGDPLTGRIEWVDYDYIDTSKGAPFFIDAQYFRYDPTRRDWGSRARQRTAFAATDIAGGEMMTFPMGSLLIPVQTSLGTSHVLATGDVVTITPKDPTSRRPRQACIRFAATDGFNPSGGMPPADNSWDTVNRYFAFSEPLPDNWGDGTFELIGWPGWSGNDIGPGGPAIGSRDNELLPYFTMPLAGAFGLNAQVYFGGDNTSLPFLSQPGNQPFTGVIDALWAGVQPGGQPRSSNRPFPPDNLVIRLGTGGAELTSAQQWLDAAALTGSVVIQTTNPVFEQELGLVLIGGEVFAYERQRQGNDWDATRSTIRLIGRGLLGSTPSIHRGPEPALVLPIGPVGRLARALSSGGNDQELFLSTRAARDTSLEDPSRSNKAVLNAPVMLLSSSDGTRMELISAPNRGVAPWHRGMYNTMVQGSWPGSTTGNTPQQDTLVIGWWPRYPSGMPNQQSQTWGALSTDQRSALMRCRMYAWMGFPLRFHDTWLTGGNGLVDIELIDDGIGTFNVIASALDQGFDWEESLATGMTLRMGGGSQDASAVCSRLQTRAVDGVEIRVHWAYQLPPADPAQGGGANANAAAAFLDRVAKAGNTAPMIGKVRLRARAPTKILQVEEAR
jgi:hypothetical protein